MNQDAKSPANGDDIVGQAALASIEFRHRLINYAIAFVGLVIAGFGGILASGLFFAREAAALLLLVSGLIFHLLHLILTHEEWLITGINRKLSRSLYAGPWGVWYDPKFVFLALLAIASPTFTLIYLAKLNVLLGQYSWLRKPIFPILLLLNIVALCVGICVRIRLFQRMKKGVDD